MGRIDGTQLKLDPLKRIEPHVMKRRSDSEVYLTLQYVVTRTLEFIERFQCTGDILHQPLQQKQKSYQRSE